MRRERRIIRLLVRSGPHRQSGGGAYVDLDIEPGEIVGLMGPNGAGKTTVPDVLSGFVVPDSGTIYPGALDLSPLSPDARAVHGLGRSFRTPACSRG